MRYGYHLRHAIRSRIDNIFRQQHQEIDDSRHRKQDELVPGAARPVEVPLLGSCGAVWTHVSGVDGSPPLDQSSPSGI
jgi:hypothetical protein